MEGTTLSNIFLLVTLNSEADVDEQTAPRAFAFRDDAADALRDEMTRQLADLMSIDDFDEYDEGVMFSIGGYRVEVIEVDIE